MPNLSAYPQSQPVSGISEGVTCSSAVYIYSYIRDYITFPACYKSLLALRIPITCHIACMKSIHLKWEHKPMMVSDVEVYLTNMIHLYTPLRPSVCVNKLSILSGHSQRIFPSYL